MKLNYKNGSLFDAPEGSVLVHACNAKGVWGRGIAKEFKTRFPKSYDEYFWLCSEAKEHGTYLPGHSFLLCEENNYQVGCLVTSYGFLNDLDPESVVLNQTREALDSLCLDLEHYNIFEVHSNMFNSGLFNVPWEKSEALLKEVLEKHPDITWTVWVSG